MRRARRPEAASEASTRSEALRAPPLGMRPAGTPSTATPAVAATVRDKAAPGRKTE